MSRTSIVPARRRRSHHLLSLHPLFFQLFFLLLVPPSAPIGATEAVFVSQGTMHYQWQGEVGPEGEIFLDLPLTKTKVNAEVTGFVARVTVQQFFSNPTQSPIEAIYKFPLPANAAVFESAIRIGDRLIVAEISEREKARKKYEAAKDAGKTTSLLEQERPNIFTQSVANIGPGENIVVALQYVQELNYDDGSYSFVFPMTVGPRYLPGNGTPGNGSGNLGTGHHEARKIAQDSHRITPPILPPGVRTGNDIELVVSVDAGFGIREIQSPSHDVFLDWQEGSKAIVSLTPGDQIPNKDFVLEYSTVGRSIETAILTHRIGDVGYFLLMVQPPSQLGTEEAVAKELVFVLDCSGSMTGFPMDTSKALMTKFIEGMNPQDTFQVIRFSEGASSMSPIPLANTQVNRQRGLDYVKNLGGSGGTKMIEGIKAALNAPIDPERQRMVFFLTDGFIGNETQILSTVRERVGETRLYALGVGTSPNRYLIEEMAREGRGFSQYVRDGDESVPVVDRFYRRLNMPVLTSVESDWGNLAISDPMPETVPDLFDQEPVFLIGRYDEPGHGTIVLRGRVGTSLTEIPVDVDLPQLEPSNSALRLLWARRKIGNLMRLQVRGEIPEIKDQVLSLALEHQLMSKYTSFVAVERKLKKGAELPLETILVPSLLPKDVSYEGNFGAAQLSMSRVKPGDPVLVVRAPEQTKAVLAVFPFGLEKTLEKDPKSGDWTCRFLVPRDQSDGRYEIQIRIVLERGDWIETTAEYVVDSTAPDFHVTANLAGGTIRFRASSRSGVFPEHADKVGAYVLPDVMSLVVRPPGGGAVLLERVTHSPGETESDSEAVWQGSYDLPAWYQPGKYTFRFLALDAARNSFTQNIVVQVPPQPGMSE